MARVAADHPARGLRHGAGSRNRALQQLLRRRTNHDRHRHARQPPRSAQTAWVGTASSRFLEPKSGWTSSGLRPTGTRYVAALRPPGCSSRNSNTPCSGRSISRFTAKDVPTLIADGCAIAAVPEREDPRDALIARGPVQLDLLPRGARIGTGSFRRQAQLLALRPDLEIVDMRGNIETRIGKMEAGGCDAVMLAAAGLRRLGMAARISLLFDFGQMMPAPGQGALALETREDVRVARYAAAVHHPDTARAVAAERAFLERMGGGCNVPIAAYARPVPGGLEIDGLVASPDGRRMVRDRVSTTGATDVEGIALLARKLLARGAREILEEFRA